MSNDTDKTAVAELMPAHVAPRSTTSLVLDVASMTSIYQMAEMMARGVATVPKHLQNNAADCMAIVMQAMQWQMNPYSIAQKTHMTQGGALGYEAQLINAVVISRAPIVSRPAFEFFGDWKKIIGKVSERTSDKGGKYYVSAWDKKDEAGLGVRCACTLRGEDEPRVLELLLEQCYPRFSTQWATDPQQQITYAAVRKWSRRYAPDVIMGVYDPEELDGEVDITPPRPKTAQQIADAARPKAETVDTERVLQLEKLAAEGGMAPVNAAWKKMTADERRTIPADDWKRIKAIGEQYKAPADPPQPEPKAVTYAELMARIHGAKSADDLEQVRADCGHLPQDQKAEILAAIDAKEAGNG